MKKTIASLITLATVSAAFLPLIALAQPKTGCTLNNTVNFEGQNYTGTITESNSLWGVICILDAIITVTNWVFYFLVVIVALLVIWGGFSIATAGGMPDNIEKGRKFIMFAMVGLAIALLSRAIPAVVIALIS